MDNYPILISRITAHVGGKFHRYCDGGYARTFKALVRANPHKRVVIYINGRKELEHIPKVEIRQGQLFGYTTH